MTVQLVTQDDLDTPETKARIHEFNLNVAERLNDDNLQLKEVEDIISDNIDDVSNNYNQIYIDTSDRNMNITVKRDNCNDDGFDH